MQGGGGGGNDGGGGGGSGGGWLDAIEPFAEPRPEARASLEREPQTLSPHKLQLLSNPPCRFQ